MGLLSILLSICGCDKENDKTQQVSDVYLDLRDIALKSGADKTINNCDNSIIKAVVLDLGISGAVATISTFCDGTVSMYYSTGGGIIGCGEHENVRVIAKDYMKAIQDSLDSFVKTESCPLPTDDCIVFYVVTDNGIYTSQATIEQLNQNGHLLTPLFYRANILMTAIRQIEPKGKIEKLGTETN